MYRILLSFFALIAVQACLAQNYYVNGYVTDKETGEPLSNVHIYEPNMRLGTLSNQDGYFMLRLPGGKRLLRVALAGYNAFQDTFFIDQKKMLKVELSVDPFPEDGSQAPTFYMDHLPGDEQITSANFEYIPQVLGEFDLVKNLQFLPGVQSGLEGSSGLFIRGSSQDQNLFLLDGIPMYNTNHLFGFFSAFNIDAVSGFRLYKGAMPAKYGSRSSSVVDISLKEGNAYEPSGKIGLGLLNVYGFLEFPIFSEKTTLAISGKRSIPGITDIVNPVYNPLLESSEPRSFFYDLSAKLTHRFSDKDKLNLIYYSAKDLYGQSQRDVTTSGQAQIRDEVNEEVKWANHVAGIQYTRLHSPRLYARYSLNYVRYSFDVNETLDRTVTDNGITSNANFDFNYNSGIDEILARADFEYRKNESHMYRFGVWQSNRRFRQGRIDATISNLGVDLDTAIGFSEALWSNELAFYAEDDIQVNSRLHTKVGMRLSTYHTSGKFWVRPEPRVSFGYLINDKMVLNGSYIYASQFIHLLSNSGIGIPTDLWLPATENIGPQGNHQASLGMQYRLAKAYELSAEVYYKAMRQVTGYREGTSPLDIQLDWEQRILQGNGEAYGLELMLQKQFGDLNGILAYTLARSTRQIEGINGGRKYNFRYDRRHQVSLNLIFKRNQRNHFAFNIVYGTGYPITFPYGRFKDINGRVVFDYQDKNGYRLKDYFRVDIGLISRRGLAGRDINTRFVQEFNISVYNLLNRFNPVYLYLSQNDQGDYEATEVALFPFFPAFNYRIKF